MVFFCHGTCAGQHAAVWCEWKDPARDYHLRKCFVAQEHAAGLVLTLLKLSTACSDWIGERHGCRRHRQAGTARSGGICEVRDQDCAYQGRRH